MAPDRPPHGPACDSCGGTGTPLLPVHRVYLRDDGRGGLRTDSTVAEVEWWCPGCRATYPHDPAGGSQDARGRGPEGGTGRGR